ncbi:hypothetical protein QF25_15930 [Salmonella enterica subsp. enterica]|nr:hypothetical protein [Salmonella enterica subsp. enterica]EDW1097494.1 hypothetical protein [Salmonella enterica subsp. enterica]MIM34116.1 hypothetical protein [Salmonella enterica subsp. enterica]
MNQSTERKDNIVKNAITAWKDRYNAKNKKGKIWMVVALIFFFFCILRILAFIFGAFGDGLPGCNDRDLINKKLPTLVLSHLQKLGAQTYGASITISKPEESYYDGKAGIRQCAAVMTLKKGNNVEPIDIEYQIAWIDKKAGKYQYKILD